MNFCGPYDKQLAAQYRPFLLTPLLAGWEFRKQPAVSVEKAGWLALAKAQDWKLTAPIRRELLINKGTIVITDTNNLIQYVNGQFEQMTGYSRQEAIGRRPAFLQGEKTSRQTRWRIRQAIEQQQSVTERLLNYRKDQTPYWCQILIQPIVNQHQQVVNFIAFEEEVPFDESYVNA